MKYPPVSLVLVSDGDPHSLSSPPHALPRGVLAQQGKATQLVLTGTVEIWKKKKKTNQKEIKGRGKKEMVPHNATAPQLM